ncbi:hypothetical protein V8J36_03080 [Frigidibacter sp. MR17.14]|uniref:MOSC domain-containing protein n=1 Tax=Frigidibacter sp. MR17.14 TaxID=3126509 RepID=UPI003012B999
MTDQTQPPAPMDTPANATAAELDAALPHILAAPKDAAVVEQLCFRPGFNKRTFPEALEFTPDRGVTTSAGETERWLAAPWMKLEDGSPDLRIQVSILPRRVMDAVWRDRAGTPHPGDTIIADLDTSEANLPVGSLLEVGAALLRVTDVFNDGCVKWKVRYGQPAKDWITAPGHPALRLRGILCEIVEGGTVRTGDAIRKRAAD